MNEERRMLLELKQLIEVELRKLEELIVFYPAKADDQLFEDYLSKAKNFRDVLKRIEERLSQVSND